MIDKLSAVINQQPDINEAGQTAKNGKTHKPGQLAANSQDEIMKAAKDMESLFAYQLLKVMRQTTESISGENDGYGNNTYMSMFDMEVSKMMAERGMGLKEAIVNWINRVPYDDHD